MSKCVHTIAYEILPLCREKPRSIAELSYKMRMKYPSLYRDIGGLIVLVELDFTKKDGKRPFGKGRLYELAAKGITDVEPEFKDIRLRDYLYFTTPIGRRCIEVFNKFKVIQKPTATIIINQMKTVIPRIKDPKLKKTRELEIATACEFFGIQLDGLP